MNDVAIQRTRSQLQARVRRLKTCPTTLFPSACRQFLAWVESNVLLHAIRKDVAAEVETYIRLLERVLDDEGRGRDLSGPVEAATIREASTLAIAALHIVARMPAPDLSREGYLGGGLGHLPALAFMLIADNSDHSTNHAVETIRDVAVEAAYEYFDEALDSRNTVMALLLKYQQRSEWYRRHRLRAMAEAGHEGLTGERAVVFDLYEYIHDHGVDFWIESKTASGVPDMVMEYQHGQRIVVDGKLVKDKNEAKRTAVKGFRQVLDYCRDHQEPVGYLAIFVLDDVRFEIAGESDDVFRCLRLDGTTVYYIIIDLVDHAETASKRPKPRVISLSREDVVLAESEPATGAEGPSDAEAMPKSEA